MVNTDFDLAGIPGAADRHDAVGEFTSTAQSDAAVERRIGLEARQVGDGEVGPSLGVPRPWPQNMLRAKDCARRSR
jgi:hypothetical protein